MEGHDYSELDKTKQSIVINFVTSYNSLKNHYIVYNTFLNKINAIYGHEFLADNLTEQENTQLSNLIDNLQYFLSDCQIYYTAICKKINVDAKELERVIKLFNELRLNYVLDRAKLYEIVEILTIFITEKIATDLLQTTAKTVHSMVS